MFTIIRRWRDRITGREEQRRAILREGEAERIRKNMHEAANRIHYLEISADLMRRKVESKNEDRQ